MMTVWIGYQNRGSEGYSEPLRVFATKDLAEVWMLGANDTWGSGAVISEHEVLGAKTETDQA